MTFIIDPYRFAVAGFEAITDDFSEADGTNLHGKATDTGGATWVVVRHAWRTIGGRANSSTITSASSAIAVLDAGISDIDMSFDLTTGNQANVDGALFRYVDLSNYFRTDVNVVADTITLLRGVAGVEANIGSASISPIGVGHTATMRVVANGSSIDVYWDGVLEISATDSAHLTVTNHGLIAYGWETYFDNFSLAAA